MAIKLPHLKSVKQKKALLITGVAVATLGIGLTIAYNMDSISFSNLFRTKASVDTYTEEFVSPIIWNVCDETPKTAVATNKNDNPRYARMKLDEYWRVKNSQTSADDHTTSDLSLTWNDNGTTKNYAVINTQNDDKWELKSDGWYYYKTPLQKDESTLSLLKSVTLNCDASLVTDGTATATATGRASESVPTAYAEAKYHLYVTMQLSDEEWEDEEPEEDPHVADCGANILYDTIACQTNGMDDGSDEHHNLVDYSAKTAKNGGNGNGVNTYAPKARKAYPVYYFRGEIDNNFVVWGNLCWRAVRTTTTGGVKLLYESAAILSGGKYYCLEMSSESDKNLVYNGATKFEFNTNRNSPADAGYMYGARIEHQRIESPRNSFVFANDVSYDGTTYTLSSDSISGTWSNKYLEAGTRYHYFCTDGSSSCDDTKIGYITYFGDHNLIDYLNIGGYANIEAAKNAMFANNTNSNVKTIIETWFDNSNLDDHENDLEDTVYCNDRSYNAGSLVGKDADASVTPYAGSGSYDTTQNFSSALYRLINYAPSLDCANKNDAFTKADTKNGNAKLAYEVGLLTSDELILAGLPFSTNTQAFNSKNYAHNGYAMHTMSPSTFDEVVKPIAAKHYLGTYNSNFTFDLRPAVSLKQGSTYVTGGNGTRNNPYVME